MNCADLEISICDYVDGALDAAQKAEVESHLADCALCAELARDASAAVRFMERAADVEPPPELVTRILFDAPWRKGANPSGAHRWINAIFSPFLQPRYVMGMAMSILSLSLMFNSVRQLRPQDYEPAKVWAGIEDRAVRSWARTVKFYDNLKVVYQMQTLLHEWQQQDEEQERLAAKTAPASRGADPIDSHKLPVKSEPEK
jgi:anti-sigma factor RsiW